jgi:DNA replication initiation complex subunit (GINS family)
LLYLPVDGGKETPSLQLSGLQTREEGDAEEVVKNTKTKMGRVLSSNLTTQGVSFAAALRGSTVQQQQRQARQVPVADPLPEVKLSTPASRQKQIEGRSVRAPTVNSQPLENMLRVVTAVQQITTEFNGAVSEEDKIVAITKIVLNLMNQNGH